MSEPRKDLNAILEDARRVEKDQAMAYRAAAADAEARGLKDVAQRFHDLHADEQHHLSRLTARLLELKQRPVDLSSTVSVPISLENWMGEVREREEREIRFYSDLLPLIEDPTSRSLVESILGVEENHLSELGGKWTMA